jgi:hypothetical protein
VTVERARARLSTRPSLRVLANPRWLAEQASRRDGARHNLYASLEFPGDNPDIEGFLDALERAINAPVSGPYAKVAQRLVRSDSADYRSAVDEMSVATRLADCGYAVRVCKGTPDIVACQGAAQLGIELTAPLKTERFYALQNRLASQWRWPTHRVMLVVGSTMCRPTPKEREAIAKAIELVASGEPAATTWVDLASIVEPTLLRATVSPGWRGVVTATGGHVDFAPPPGIQEAIEKKRPQLLGSSDIMLAVNLGGLHVDPYSWSMQTSRDFSDGASPQPSVDAPANVLGVLAFNGGVPGQALTLPIWLPNSARTEANPTLLQPVLMSLGWPGQRIVSKPNDGL